MSTDTTNEDGGRLVECCPVCGYHEIHERKHKTPRYRCGNGHEFEEPDSRRSRSNRVSSEELLEDIRRLADEFGRPPTSGEYDRQGGHSYHTARKHFDGWHNAIEAAGLDPGDIPNRRKRTGSNRFVCYHCGDEFFSDSTRRHIPCPHCRSTVSRWRGRIAFYAQNMLVTQLAEAPLTEAELPYRPDHSVVRSLAHRLTPPATGPGSTKSRPDATTVYFLPGDDRRAVTRFIEANEKYVASCFGDHSNPLSKNWTEEYYQLLVEQWHWLGYNHGGDGHE